MDASDLAIFAAVARTGCITKAAEVVNTVQSNVTHRIRVLEDELGVPLFHRHSRGVTLTSAGIQLLPYAQRISHLLSEAKEVATDGPTPRGKVVVGAMETATALRLPPILAAYAASFPQVEIEVNTGTSAGLIQAVLESQIQVAFVAGPLSHPDLVALPVIDEELVLVTAPWVLDLNRLWTGATAEKLKIIVFRAGCSYRARLEAILAARGIVGMRRLDFGSLDGILGCVGAGAGITLLPRAVVANAAAEGRIAFHTLPAEEACVPTVLIRRRDAFVSTALLRFIELARERLAAVSAAQQQSESPRFLEVRPLRPGHVVATTLRRPRGALHASQQRHSP